MDKRNRRTVAKMENIKRAALDLFTAHGPDKVSMDEIAAKANVSKVTIYKYFGSKEELYAEVINLFVDETLAATADIINSDMDFLEKLKFPLLIQTRSAQLVGADQLFQIWEADHHLTADMHETIQSKIKALMAQLFQEGKDKGHINQDIPFDILYLYTDIFRAGFKSKAASALVDHRGLEALYDLFFFGFINRK